MYADNMNGKTSASGSDNNYLHNNAPELSIINFQGLLQAKSVLIDDNEDPGSNPPDDYFGVLGNLAYPLKNLEIADTDEMVVIIRPTANIKSDKLDAYIAYNTEVVKQAKDELCYFFTAPGTTPTFYVSIYKNGVAIEKDIGVFGLHLSKLGDEFRPVKRTNLENQNTIVSIRNDFFDLVELSQ
jgi:hypothetical protein